MNPQEVKDMFEQFREDIKVQIATSIKENVNGKITTFQTDVNRKLEAQDEAIKPVIDWFCEMRLGKKMVMQILTTLALLGTIGVGFSALIKGISSLIK